LSQLGGNIFRQHITGHVVIFKALCVWFVCLLACLLFVISVFVCLQSLQYQQGCQISEFGGNRSGELVVIQLPIIFSVLILIGLFWKLFVLFPRRKAQAGQEDRAIRRKNKQKNKNKNKNTSSFSFFLFLLFLSFDGLVISSLIF